MKDWDIQINYGIKTGFNDAFIISTEKRNEILSNCKDADERKRTEELIRPILRGRDIKRYGYNWANLWIINTHNGIKGKLARIEVNEYPAIKAHLDQYWDKISKRADKGDTPYNLRNCVYMVECCHLRCNTFQLIEKRITYFIIEKFGTHGSGIFDKMNKKAAPDMNNIVLSSMSTKYCLSMGMAFWRDVKRD